MSGHVYASSHIHVHVYTHKHVLGMYICTHKQAHNTRHIHEVVHTHIHLLAVYVCECLGSLCSFQRLNKWVALKLFPHGSRSHFVHFLHVIGPASTIASIFKVNTHKGHKPACSQAGTRAIEQIARG